MRKAEKAQFIQRELDKLYPTTPIPLDHYSAYTLLIAVLLSAQCTDIRVNQVTPALFRLSDTAPAMAKQKVEDIESIVRPCGLGPAKSKNILALSKRLTEEFNGEVPEDWEVLESLPGVGHKTASVVMSQWFGQPAFPVDTHIHRLLYRWGISNGKNVTQSEADAKKLFPKETWNKLHLQIIFYGREYSPARGAREEKDFITMAVAGKIKNLS
jgi:endonuclease-3